MTAPARSRMPAPAKRRVTARGRARRWLIPVVGAAFAAYPLLHGCARASRPEATSRAGAGTAGSAKSNGNPILTGAAALGDWTTDAPGVRRRITSADLPPPYDTPSVDRGPEVVARPSGRLPRVPNGFRVSLFAGGLENPRVIVTAPNGDLFISESAARRVRLLRDRDGDGKPELSTVFVDGLNQPFGLAFHPPGPNPRYLYVANTDSVVRFPYRSGDTRASGPPEMIVASVPEGGRLRGGGHWTRDIAFSKDGRKLWVSVGSRSNVDEEPIERASVHEYNPDGSGFRIYAWGIRNPVGLAVHPVTGDLWTSVNERDGLGDHLVPDYVTRVRRDGFYGWPWYYIGSNPDPRHPGKRPDLKGKVIVPDVLLQSHSASLDLAFYTGDRFPKEYRGHIFACEHGSWNRNRRTGYKVIRIPVANGRATGVYEDFMTGFVLDESRVYGRPVGVTTGRDGSLYVTDDGSGSVWRVSYGSSG